MSSAIDAPSRLKTLEEYRRACQTFRLECPEYFNFGFDVMDRWAKQRPDHAAMRWVSSEGDDRTITFAELAKRSNQVANALLDLGLRRGDQVLVDLPNLVEWQNPDATADCYRGEWYLTGDCACTDEDGYFWFVARADDIITSAAYRIGPFEVENALMEHPAVAEVAVVGKPDPARTEIVKAFIVLANGYAPSEELSRELQEHTKQATAPYKYPREIEFTAELPKTHTGKIRRTKLRKRGSRPAV